MTDPAVSRQPLTRVDTRSLPAVYDANFAYVWHLVRRLGVHERYLEDAVHDVFVVVHRRWTDFDQSRPVKPWLAGIATRVAADFRRRASHRREEPVAEVQAIEARPDAEDVVARRDAERLVYAALERLDEDRRVVLVLHDLEQHTVPEIRDALEVPLNTLYSRLRLARRDFAAAVRELRGGAP